MALPTFSKDIEEAIRGKLKVLGIEIKCPECKKANRNIYGPVNTFTTAPELGGGTVGSDGHIVVDPLQVVTAVLLSCPMCGCCATFLKSKF